jgi:serine/threonine-protein kinase
MSNIDANDRLDEVLARYLRAADRDRAPPPQSLVALYPEWASELRAFFADQEQVEALTAPVRAAVLDRHFARSSPPDRTGERLGPYRLDEEIGRGGMGVVYRAWDTQLNRPVAVKTIRTPSRATPEALARFRSEAVAVARLQHPNIVQVFETGEHAGQPYAVLEYVPGGSLAQLLTGRSVRPAAAAALVETLARAVHYAHQRGVIHRDLKPANILLAVDSRQSTVDSEDEKPGRSSELPTAHCPLPTVKIADFGLAKVLDDGGEALTETGAVLGTPTYMAPEQAHGRGAEVGPAADVYALGVLLYELITGRPPFCGVTKLDTLRQVTNDPPTPPRRLAADCPRDLETVCLRCLEKEPARRYASAEVLADELRRFLDGKPILARPPGPLGRAWRWCRRQPWLATLIVALSVCTALLGGQWWRAERNAAEARAHAVAADQATREANRLLAEAVEQQRRAEVRFRTAHGAVRDLAVWLSEKALNNVPPLVRKDLLDRAIKHYEEFVREKADDPVLRFELADLCFRAAQVTSAIGSKAEALARYRRAADLYAELLRDDPTNQRYLTEQAHIFNNCGILHDELGNRPEALAAFHGGLEAYHRLHEANPEDRAYQFWLAGAHNNLGATEADAGDYEPALEHFRQARAIREELARADPRSLDYQLKLADTDGNLGMALRRLGRREESRRAYEQARQRREELAQQHPNNTDVQLKLANSYRMLSDEQRDDGRADEAITALRKGQAAAEAAVRAAPSLIRAQAELAACLFNLGEVCRASGRADEALEHLQGARLIQEKLVRLSPGARTYKADLARTYYEVGCLHVDRSQRTDARQAFAISRDLWDELVRTAPAIAAYRIGYAETLHKLGQEFAELGRFDDAVDLLHLAVAQCREAFGRTPGAPRPRESLVDSYAALTGVELKRGRAADAVAAVRERLKLAPTDPAQLFAAARDVALAAELPDRDGRRKEYVRLTVETLRAAVANGFTDAGRIDRDRAFAPVRSDPGFQALMAGLRR